MSEEEYLELVYLFDDINTAKDVMPELDIISSDILTGVNAVGRQDGKVIVGCCIKQGHNEIVEQVREILDTDGTPLSLSMTSLIDNALTGEYTFSCLGDATRVLPLI